MEPRATRRHFLRAASGLALAGANGPCLTASGFAQSPAPVPIFVFTSYLAGPEPASAPAASFAAKAREIAAGAFEIDVGYRGGMSLPVMVLSQESEFSYFLSHQGRDADWLFALSSVPMLATSFDEAQILLDVARPYYARAFERFDLVLLAAEPWRPAALWSAKPIESAADLKGTAFDLMNMAQVAGWQRPLLRAGARYSPFGAEMMLTWPHDRNVAVHEPLYSFFTEIFLAAQLRFLVAGRTFLAGLPAAQREALVDAGRFVEAEAWRERRVQVTREHKEIAALGCTVTIDPPRALMAALAAAAEPDIADWAGRIGPDGHALVAEYRKRIART